LLAIIALPSLACNHKGYRRLGNYRATIYKNKRKERVFLSLTASQLTSRHLTTNPATIAHFAILYRKRIYNSLGNYILLVYFLRSRSSWIMPPMSRHVPVTAIPYIYIYSINLVETKRLSRKMWYPEPSRGLYNYLIKCRTTACVLFPLFPAFLVLLSSLGVRTPIGLFFIPGTCQFQMIKNPL